MTDLAAGSQEKEHFKWDGALLDKTTFSGAVSGTIEQTYDDNFRLVSRTVNSGSGVAFGYDDDDLLTSAGDLDISRDPDNGAIVGTTVDQFSSNRTYDEYGEVSSVEHDGPMGNTFSVQYTYDDLGRIATKTEVIGGQTRAWKYVYDDAGHLSEVYEDKNRDGSFDAGERTAKYAYDKNGNRTAVTTPRTTLAAGDITYDDQDRLLKYGHFSYTYTAAGDLQSKTDTATNKTTKYAYDGLGHLREVDLPGGHKITYLVDGAGHRIGKKVDGTLRRRGSTPAPSVPSHSSTPRATSPHALCTPPAPTCPR